MPSYVVVACTSDRRWFDLDAVRTEGTTPPQRRFTVEWGQRGGDDKAIKYGDNYLSDTPTQFGNPAGAPPLDWWDANDDPTPTPQRDGATMTNTVTFHRGDIRDVMATMPDHSVDLLVTSPPFLALRSYLPADHVDKHREIGSEPTPAAYLEAMLQLTAEWRRLVTATGSICVEIGDTYAAGGGGAFGDYKASTARGTNRVTLPDGRSIQSAGIGNGQLREGPGWPLPKSLCGIPTLYAWSLAYGVNLLTGQPSPAGRLRVRNLLTWTRPNPPVGALGDKFRPATSFVTVACASDKRWFDLDAVRTEHATPLEQRNDLGSYKRNHESRGSGGDVGRDKYLSMGNPAGAPPLDWWDHDPDWQPLHRLPTAPYKGTTTTARRVPCGPDDGGERTTSPDCPTHGDRPAPAPTAQHDGHATAHPVPTSHTPRSEPRPELEPLPDSAPTAPSNGHSTGRPAPSPEGAPVATGRNTPSHRTDPAPSTNQPGTPSAESLDGTARTSTSPSSDTPHPDRSESNTATADSHGHHPDMSPRTVDIDTLETPCTCSFHKTVTESSSHYAAYPVALPRRLIESMCPRQVCTVCGEGRRRIAETTNAVGHSVYQSPGRDRLLYDAARDINKVAPDRTERTTLGWSDCGHNQYRPGIVLDPFAGSGTSAVAAALCGRDAVLIDLDHRNIDLCRRRFAETMLIVNETTDGDITTWTVRHDMPGTKHEHPDQLSLFAG